MTDELRREGGERMSFGEGNLRTAVAELQARIDELERENATLAIRLELQEEETAHQSADYVDEQKRCADLERENDELQAENEQLKQLARELMECRNHDYCADCPLYKTCNGFGQRMNELGIEVEQ